MKRRWVQIEGELVEVDQDYTPEPRADFHVMPDIQPYRSQLTGKIVNSRSVHRAELRSFKCVEVGNETKALFSKVKPLSPPPGLKETIIAVANSKLIRR